MQKETWLPPTCFSLAFSAASPLLWPFREVFFSERRQMAIWIKLRTGNWSVVVATKIVGQVWFNTSSLGCCSFHHLFYCTQFSLSFDLHWVCFEICNIVVGKWISNGRLISSSGINSPRQLKLDLVGWVSGLVGGWAGFSKSGVSWSFNFTNFLWIKSIGMNRLSSGTNL